MTIAYGRRRYAACSLRHAFAGMIVISLLCGSIAHAQLRPHRDGLGYSQTSGNTTYVIRYNDAAYSFFNREFDNDVAPRQIAPNERMSTTERSQVQTVVDGKAWSGTYYNSPYALRVMSDYRKPTAYEDRVYSLPVEMTESPSTTTSPNIKARSLASDAYRSADAGARAELPSSRSATIPRPSSTSRERSSVDQPALDRGRIRNELRRATINMGRPITFDGF